MSWPLEVVCGQDAHSPADRLEGELDLAGDRPKGGQLVARSVRSREAKAGLAEEAVPEELCLERRQLLSDAGVCSGTERQERIALGPLRACPPVVLSAGEPAEEVSKDGRIGFSRPHGCLSLGAELGRRLREGGSTVYP